MSLSTHTCQNGCHQKEHNKCWWECGEKGALMNSWWECTLVQPTVWRFQKRLKLKLTIGPSNSTSWYTYPKNQNKLIWKDTCTPVFTATLFTIAKIQKQPTCSLAGEWIKMYVCTVGLYSVIKKNEILLSTRWVDLEDMIPSKVSHTEKDKNWQHLHVESKTYNKLVTIIKKQQTQKEQPSGERKGKTITHHRYTFPFVNTYLYPGLFPMCLFPFKISFSTREGCEV